MTRSVGNTQKNAYSQLIDLSHANIVLLKIATFSLTVIKLADITVFICLFPVGDPVWSQIEKTNPFVTVNLSQHELPFKP